jgi:dihydroneopterin aldolase
MKNQPSNSISSLKIALTSLEIICIIGALPHERITEQAIEIDLEFTPLQHSFISTDSLIDTIDYTKVAAVCSEVAHKGQFHLLENLAHAIAQALFNHFEIKQLKLKVSKKRPLPHLAASAVEIILERKSDGSI